MMMKKKMMMAGAVVVLHCFAITHSQGEAMEKLSSVSIFCQNLVFLWFLASSRKNEEITRRERVRGFRVSPSQ